MRMEYVLNLKMFDMPLGTLIQSQNKQRLNRKKTVLIVCFSKRLFIYVYLNIVVPFIMETV